MHAWMELRKLYLDFVPCGLSSRCVTYLTPSILSFSILQPRHQQSAQNLSVDRKVERDDDVLVCVNVDGT